MSLVATLMQSLRAKYSQDLDKNELRRSKYGVYDSAVRQTNSSNSILSDDVRTKIKKSFGNSVVVPVLNSDAVTIGNVRSCTVADSENTSALVTLTFATYAWGFNMYPAQHFNNDISYQNDWNRKFEKYLLQFAATLDTAGYNVLNTNRNKIFNADTQAQYTVTGTALRVPLAGQDNFYNVMDAIMNSMDFYSNPFEVIANTFHQPVVNKFINQGAGNSENLAFQFAGYEFGYDNRVTNGSGVTSTAFVMPQGSFAVENRNDPDAIANSKAGDGTEWSEVTLPILNMKVGQLYKSNCADASGLSAGTTGLTATKRESFEWSTDVCWVTAYNRDPNTLAGPIQKVEFLNA